MKKVVLATVIAVIFSTAPGVASAQTDDHADWPNEIFCGKAEGKAFTQLSGESSFAMKQGWRDDRTLAISHSLIRTGKAKFRLIINFERTTPTVLDDLVPSAFFKGSLIFVQNEGPMGATIYTFTRFGQSQYALLIVGSDMGTWEAKKERTLLLSPSAVIFSTTDCR